MRKLGVLVAAVALLVLAPSAGAEITSVFGGIPCHVAPNGDRRCSGSDVSDSTVPTWDGTRIDVNVAFPPEPATGPDGPYPMIMYFHGYGGGKEGFDGDIKRFTEAGYAAFTMTERGFKNSCGTAEARQALTGLYGADACARGYIHLMDTRYEVRDAQYLAGLLVDQGLVVPDRIGAVGASYGGGKSMALAALRNRIMLPDGTLAPWRSPAGTPLELAAAAPIVPWTDFAYAVAPNGRVLDYVADAPYEGPFGVLKAAIINLLFISGDNYVEPGVDPAADLPTWLDAMNAGEPYGGGTSDYILDQMTRFHSSYYIDDSVQPAPLLIAEGFADDLFPIDEALRYYNRTRARHPDADVSLLFADIGHPRAPLSGENAQGRPADIEMGYQRVEGFFAHYVAGTGPKPPGGVEVKTQVCPYESPSGGPYRFASWAAAAPGEVTLRDDSAKLIAADGGNPAIAAAFTTGLADGCTRTDALTESGVAQYTMDVPAGGLTLMGAPTVIAELSGGGEEGQSQVAARLLDVDPVNGKQTLIARALYRPRPEGLQVFQLHGNAYRFEGGHRLRLQLLPRDGQVGLPVSYGRPSNDQRDITVSGLELRLPVAEAPGAGGGAVRPPKPKVLPEGEALAPDYAAIGSVSLADYGMSRLSLAGPPRVKGRTVKLTLACPAATRSCGTSTIRLKGSTKRRKARGNRVPIARGGGITVEPGGSRTVALGLTGRARKLFADRKVRIKGKRARRGASGHRRPKARVKKGLKRLRVSLTVSNERGPLSALVTLKRTGKVRR